MGPNSRRDSRARILERMIALLERASSQGAQLVVFPELAFTTFFPRWMVETDADIERYFERAMPNPSVQPLFDRARQLRIGFHVGYAELTAEGHRYNTAVVIAPDGRTLLKYRKTTNERCRFTSQYHLLTVQLILTAPVHPVQPREDHSANRNRKSLFVMEF